MLQDFLREAGYTTFGQGQGDVRVFLAGLVQSALSLVAILFFLVILYGGYLWLTAGGNEEQVKKAQSILKAGLIGFVITLLSYALTKSIAGRIGFAAM